MFRRSQRSPRPRRRIPRGFLKEILQILPLVGLRVFEFPKAVPTPRATSAEALALTARSHQPDTIIVPAQEEGFGRVFLGENCWYAIRIAGGMIDKIKYIAAYQSRPVSAITHYAPVDRIEPYGDSGKYKVVFSGPASPIGPIPFGNAPSGAHAGTEVHDFGAAEVRQEADGPRRLGYGLSAPLS